MGLDMYLTARRYLSRYDNDEAQTRQKIADALTVEIGGDVLEPEAVQCSALYWRKANAVHGWFVDHVQGGEDNCRRFPVAPDQLAELRDLCRHLLEHPDDAPQMLPPRQGFFFGSYELDQYYWQDVRYTAEALERLLQLPTLHSWDLHYQSSW